jgi:phosphoribosylanthranilate isomerase
MTAIKICGITDIGDARYAAACGVDALGFIFYPGSPRYISPAAAKDIIATLPESVASVGVFVNQPEDDVLEIADLCHLDFIQLHGDESPAYCRHFDPSRLIKAVSAVNAGATTAAEAYAVKAFLVDAREGDRFGGTGKRSDWDFAGGLATKRRLILAGGLNEGNVLAAIERVSPSAVDINSGVETSPGKKDHEKIARIIKIIRENDRLSCGEAGLFRREP